MNDSSPQFAITHDSQSLMFRIRYPRGLKLGNGEEVADVIETADSMVIVTENSHTFWVYSMAGNIQQILHADVDRSRYYLGRLIKTTYVEMGSVYLLAEYLGLEQTYFVSSQTDGTGVVFKFETPPDHCFPARRDKLSLAIAGTVVFVNEHAYVCENLPEGAGAEKLRYLRSKFHVDQNFPEEEPFGNLDSVDDRLVDDFARIPEFDAKIAFVAECPWLEFADTDRDYEFSSDEDSEASDD